MAILAAEAEETFGAMLGRMLLESLETDMTVAESGESAMLPGLTEAEGGFVFNGHFTNGQALIKLLDRECLPLNTVAICRLISRGRE